MNKKLIDLIKKGGIGVLPTDTIYGIHCLALKKDSVEKLYEIRERNPKKPFIILISSIGELVLFKIKLERKTKEFLRKIWPNKISVLLPCPKKEFLYLHRGTNKLAFRFPNKRNLIDIIKETGPLISTSVNPEGLEPAYTIAEAKRYFGNKLDFYIDKGEIKSLPSTLIEIKKGKIEILRQGEVKIPT